MTNRAIESGPTSPAPEVNSLARFSRRRFLQGTAALGLSAATVFGAPQATEANASPDLTVELPTETNFISGPGNNLIRGTRTREFGSYAVLPVGTLVELNGSYIDFVRAKATYEKEKNGKTRSVTKNGYIYKGDLPSVPDTLRELTIDQVPWVKEPMVTKDGFAVEAGSKTATQFTPYYKIVEDNDARIDVKMTGTGPISDSEQIGLIIHNPDSTQTQLFSFLNIIKRDGYWALTHQQGDQGEEIAQLIGTDDVEASLRISKDGSTVTVEQGDTKSDPIVLSTPLYTKTRILDLYGVNAPSEGSLTVNQLNYLTPPSGKYVREK